MRRHTPDMSLMYASPVRYSQFAKLRSLRDCSPPKGLTQRIRATRQQSTESSQELKWLLNINNSIAITLHVAHSLLQNLLRNLNCSHVAQCRHTWRVNIHCCYSKDHRDHIESWECPHRNDLFWLCSHIYTCHFKWGKKQSCLKWAYILTAMSATLLGTLSKKGLEGIKLKSGWILVQKPRTVILSCEPQLPLVSHSFGILWL